MLTDFDLQGSIHRRVLQQILTSVIDAIDPKELTSRALSTRLSKLTNLKAYRRVMVLGLGKAAIPMALAAEEFFDTNLSSGLVVTRRGDLAGADRLTTIDVAEGDHPVPSEESADAARRLLERAEGAGPDDLVICLISGGGSALTTLPAPGLTVDDLRRTTDILLSCGADIVEFNALRKHLSAFSGGRLARAIHPARQVTLILSDVVGNPLDVIASGPTVADPTTFDDALKVVEKYELANRLPAAVVDHLRAGAAGRVDETPGEDSKCFEDGALFVVGDNKLAAQAAAEAAEAQGWNARILTTFMEGEARELGKFAVSLGREAAHHQRPAAPPACLILSGESTVTLRGDGKGGRNQELALAALCSLRGAPNIAVATFATDGVDGPTTAAGAIADEFTWRRTTERAVDPEKFLRANDSHSFFELTGDLIESGPTGSNLNDLVLIFVTESS